MFLLARLMLALSACALVVVAGAASTPTQSLDPPQLLQPTAGQAFKAGTSIVFRIRTHPADRYLWLYVSRSPSIVKACGTIAHEVSIWDFDATSDSAVYEAGPKYYSYDGFWMNTPGTYYWQAYRIEHAGGADGCIESAIRSFTITAAGKPKPAPTPTPKPKPATKAPLAVSNARLVGEFDVTTKITSASGIDVKRGETDSGTWRFTPKCSAGACSVRLRYEYRGASFDSHTVRIALKKAGTVYKGAATTPLVECSFKDVPGVMNLRLEVTKGAWLDGRWRATRIVGRYEYDAPETTSGIYRCPAARITATVRGSLST